MPIDQKHIDNLFHRLSKSKFRSSFKLSKKDREYLEQKGFAVIEQHAYDFINKRLVPAFPENDGKQTPAKNHPVFTAQHATALPMSIPVSIARTTAILPPPSVLSKNLSTLRQLKRRVSIKESIMFCWGLFHRSRELVLTS